MASFERFEDIKAWQKALDVTLRLYRLTGRNEFAKDFGLRDQIRRASVSMMANIAEGHGRRTNTEFANFPNLARGSAAEVQSHLHIAVGLEYISAVDFRDIYSEVEQISKMTLALSRYLRQNGKQ